MKIVIVGPGALGCLVAASIKNKMPDEVWLLDRLPERAKSLKDAGLKVEGVSGSYSVKMDATSDPKDIGRADLVIICVKSYSTEDACRQIKDIVGEETSVVTLQNGIGNVQVLNDNFGPERVMAGITNHGATLIGTGHVRHAGKGDTIIGKADGRLSGALKSVSAIFTKAGFVNKITKDIDSAIWSKLVINVGINALTAVTRLNNGKLVLHEESRALLRAAVQEAARVVKRKRIKLAYDDAIQKVESVAKATGLNVSSMLQDVLNRKRTEIDFINGAIVRQAKSLGIPAPVNEVLAGLVKTIESSYEESKNNE
jgi:2-dehydropantoate 2-reductase